MVFFILLYSIIYIYCMRLSSQLFPPQAARERCSTSQLTVKQRSIFQADRRERTSSLPDSPTASHLCPAPLGYFLVAST